VSIYDTIGELLSQLERRSNHGEEVFIQCVACGEWEGHTEDCHVPAVKAWLNEPFKTIPVAANEVQVGNFVRKEDWLPRDVFYEVVTISKTAIGLLHKETVHAYQRGEEKWLVRL